MSANICAPYVSSKTSPGLEWDFCLVPDSNIDPKSCVFFFSCVFILQQLQINTVYPLGPDSSSARNDFFFISTRFLCHYFGGLLDVSVSCSKFTYIKLLLLIDNNN